MSPTLMRLDQYRIVVYPRDHKPPHIHIVGPDAEMKVNIVNWEIIEIRGLSWRTAQKMLLTLKSKESYLLEAWNRIHEKES